jgi:hypothetical protein
MRVTTGKVVFGKVADEGAVVTVLAPEDSETFELSPEAKAALLAAIGEADRGEVVSGDEVLRKLDRNG